MLFQRFFYRRFIRPIVTAHDTPHAIALGVAVGMAVGFLPFLGLQMIIALFAATILGANRLVAVALVWISNPLTAAPLFWLDYRVGTKLLGIAPISRDLINERVGHALSSNFWQIIAVFGGDIFQPMIVGGVVLGVIVGAVLYPVSLWALKSRERRIRENLRQALRKRKLILASSSERRRRLLSAWGYKFEVVEPGVDEITESKLSPAKTARHNARRKAQAAAKMVGDPDAVIVAADTLTLADKKLIGKPTDEADAERILGELSDTRHSVITALCAIDMRTGKTIVADDEAFVHMRELTPQEIRDYVKSGEAMGKAGAYAVQETGDRFIRKIRGNFDTVVGFPRYAFEKMMHRLLIRQKAKDPV